MCGAGSGLWALPPVHKLLQMHQRLWQKKVRPRFVPFSTRGEHGGDGQVRILGRLLRKFNSAHAVVGLRPRAMARKMRLNERNWSAGSDPVPAERTKFNELQP